MSQICDCENEILDTIPANACNNSIGFIKKWAFQLQGTNFDGSGSPPSSAIEALASWQAFIAASDATKMVVTRKFTDALIPASEAVTEEADADTLVVRENNVIVPSMFRGLSPEEIEAIKALACYGNLGVYGITENNQILAYYVSPNVYTAIPIVDNTFRLSSPEVTGGFDKSMMNFGWKSDWRENTRLITPNFNALTLIVPA
jgi:hypothetical protein